MNIAPDANVKSAASTIKQADGKLTKKPTAQYDTLGSITAK